MVGWRCWAALERLLGGLILASTVGLTATAENVHPSNETYLSSKPSFDCAEAQNSVAFIICADRDGALADWDLNSAGLALKGLLDRGDRQFFDQDEIFWVRALASVCALPADPARISMKHKSCVIRSYHKRAELYRRELDGDALAESKLTPEDHARIQNALLALGLLQDRADGKFGPRTREAIRQYQLTRKLPQKGFLSTESIKQLLADHPGLERRPNAEPGGRPSEAVLEHPKPEPASPPDLLEGRSSPVNAAFANAGDEATGRMTAHSKIAEVDKARRLAEEQVTKEHAARVAAEDRAAAAEKRAAEAQAAKQIAERQLAEASAADQFGWHEYAIIGAALFGVAGALYGGFVFGRSKRADPQPPHAFDAKLDPERPDRERLACEPSDISAQQTTELAAVPSSEAFTGAEQVDPTRSLPGLNSPATIAPEQLCSATSPSPEPPRLPDPPGPPGSGADDPTKAPETAVENAGPGPT